MWNSAGPFQLTAQNGGIATGSSHEFGAFPDDTVLAYGEQFTSDNRTPDSDRFFVRTPDGGRAFVRITARGWPRTTLEYVWLPSR